MIPTARLGRAGASGTADASGRLPVLSGSAVSSGTKPDGASFGGSEARLHESADASGSRARGSSIASGTGIGNAACSDDLRTIHSSSFGDGNGLDSASGIATKNTKTPHSTPATRMAECEIRSADIVARDTRITNSVPLSLDDCPRRREVVAARTPAPPSAAPVMLCEQDYFGVNRRNPWNTNSRPRHGRAQGRGQDGIPYLIDRIFLRKITIHSGSDPGRLFG